jgi:hypothetical protein
MEASSFSFRFRPAAAAASSSLRPPANAKANIPYFQHNKNVPVTPKTYAYVRDCKQQLVREVTSLLDRLGIRFVISHGNLLEWVRGRPIFHDDDVDFRFCEEDIPLWQAYLDASPEHWSPPGLRIVAANRRKHFYKVKIVSSSPKLQVVLDLVAHGTSDLVWIPYDIDFDARREVEYMGVRTYVPSETDVAKVLKLDYGPNYLVPDRAAPRWAVGATVLRG